jgi:hypothetical protein
MPSWVATDSSQLTRVNKWRSQLVHRSLENARGKLEVVYGSVSWDAPFGAQKPEGRTSTMAWVNALLNYQIRPERWENIEEC